MSNGDLKTIYCHFDGYPEHHVPILLESYDTQEKVESLIALGSLSLLSHSTKAPEGHTWRNPVEGYCVAYCRDRGEKGRNVEAMTSNTLYEALEEYRGEYNYYWNGNEWLLDGEPIEEIEHLFIEPKC